MKKQSIFTEAMNLTVSWLYRATPAMLLVTLFSLISAGTITALTVGNGAVEEGNLALAKVMTQYGNWVVAVFLAEIIIIIIAVYFATRRLARKNAYAKAFHALMFTFLLLSSLLDFGNDLTLGAGHTELWTKYFTIFQAPNPLKDFLWKRSNFETRSTFTTAVYNGTHLIDYVVECRNGVQINSYPTPAMIYVGTSWTERYADRNAVMRC